MSSKPVYYPQLDTLRAIAVILVIISHWLPEANVFNRYFLNGESGVTLFFVLSGFLITTILLNNKISVESGMPKSRVLKNFYIRRSLRIFPVYYLLLIALCIANYEDVRHSFFWHFFYGSNFYFWLYNTWKGPFHFWSLSVEEQFYLLWPSIVLFLPLRRLPAVFVTGIILAITFRLCGGVQPIDTWRRLMPGSLDSFCIGALLAYGNMYTPHWFTFFHKHKARLLITFMFLYIILSVRVSLHFNTFIFQGLFFPVASFFSAMVIYQSIQTKNRFFSQLLQNKALIYVGKISYGIYLYHVFVPFFYHINTSVFGSYSIYIVTLLRFIITMLIASASWYLIEKPILKLKKKFDYPIKDNLEIQMPVEPLSSS